MKKCSGSEELFSVKQRRLGNNLNIVQRYEEKLFIFFLLRANSRKWVFAAIWGIHVIIENSFLRQKFFRYFFQDCLIERGLWISLFWRSLNTKCFLISLVFFRHNSIKYVGMKIIQFPESLNLKLESGSFFSVKWLW